VPQCKSLIFSHWKLFCRPPFYPALVLATFINFCSGSRRRILGVLPPLIPIKQFEFLCEFYFIIAFFMIALFTIQLKRKDGSVGSPPIEGTRMADQSRKHPFAQLNSLSLNISFNSHRFQTHFPLPAFLKTLTASPAKPRNVAPAAASPATLPLPLPSPDPTPPVAGAAARSRT
jgi:hypothetical protein